MRFMIYLKFEVNVLICLRVNLNPIKYPETLSEYQIRRCRYNRLALEL